MRPTQKQKKFKNQHRPNTDMEKRDNFTSAMYTRHIFLSEKASSFSEDKKINKNLKQNGKEWGKGIRQQNTVLRDYLLSKDESVCRLVTFS